MKFMKYGKAILTGALSLGTVFGVSSCVESYTVGFLYVTGTVTASPNGEGKISGFKIDHNTGQLVNINTLPVGSGGANPVRAVLANGSTFLYVLNRGVNAAGTGDCYGTDTTTTACLNSNISVFEVGGNGSLTAQANLTSYPQGLNPFRMIIDSTGNYLLVLDHDQPSVAGCQAALGTSVTACGDITVFQINSTTGRLTLVQNVTATGNAGSPITYFPVPANPVDFVLSSNFVLTLFSNNPPTPNSFPYTGGTSVYPYSYSGTSGQLTVSQNGVQPLGINEGNSIINASSNIYVLDNEPVTIAGCSSSNCPFNSGTSPLTYPGGQVIPYSVGANGALQPQTGGAIPISTGLANPIELLIENKGTYMYVANQGTSPTAGSANSNPESGISGYFLNKSPFQAQFIDGQPFGSGSGPQCIVEDPSNQFIYEANAVDSTVTGRIVDPNSGVLNDLRVAESYSLPGPASWCLMDGRTN
jgi:Lactonase, 7-bladed beta-propeller